MKTLVLFTNGFPYNIAEPFLEHEVSLYKEHFDKVLIVTACKRGEKATRSVDNSYIEVVNDYTLSKDPLSVIKAIPLMLLDRRFYAEIAEQYKQKKLSMGRLYEIAVFSLCGNSMARKAIRWLKRHKENQCNVLYSYWLHIPAYAAVRANDMLSGRCYTISRAHGFDVYLERRPSHYIPFHRCMYHALDEIASVSDHGKVYLEAHYGAVGKVKVQRLGAVDYGKRNPLSNRDIFKIVTCARTIPLKRLDRLVDALKQITDHQIEWTHIGDGEVQAELEQYAAEHLPPNVTVNFLGRCTNEQVYEAYSQIPFHVFVNVSESEGLPVSIMEAMSFGIPVIATAVGGTSEIVSDKTSGILIRADFTNDELIGSIKSMITMRQEEYIAFRHNAYLEYEAHYNAQNNYLSFIANKLKIVRLRASTVDHRGNMR